MKAKILHKRLRIGVDARNLTSHMTGIGRYVHELSRELIAGGHDLILYLPEKPNAQVAALNGARLRLARMPGPILRQIWGHAILPVQLRRDALDVFWGPAHRLPPFLPADLARVVTIHDLVWLHAPETMRTRTRLGEQVFMRQSLARADIVVADSEATGRDISAAFPDLGREIVTIHAGVSGRPPVGVPPPLPCGIDRPYVLFVGTLEPRKNLKRLLDAWRLLPEERRRDWLLVIAGGKGWGIDDMAGEIAARSLDGSVRLTGFVSEDELDALYVNAMLLAMPSLYEGFGLPIVEANARGVPALTSNLSCLPEIAGPGAILVDPTSPASIAAGLDSVLSGQRDWKTLSRAARANAARFDWSTAARQLLNVFETAIATRRAA
ncbi:glycosyltransferase family 1 protein [Aliihoeflea sp. 40Bstr573]|uniref:glycosyltransferase family 4 protein n=1 Tax=Aliihoeflea sp. 40Bstr573 TaxID=2696467 RepID=UPI00209573C8|nr:glycosyltransferase family 1 protein [Aliihoeflea sp. 40Bstr573]MCO6387495.1 glycosyltransferase [Aliihoeflea sp. 40Bstr573]